VDSAAQTWESAPQESSADASHLSGLSFDAPSAQEWLQQLGQTPEEDLLTEALVQDLTERGEKGRRLPEHAPAAVTPEDKERLRKLFDAVASVEKALEDERAGLGEARAELACREAELKEREAALEKERALQRQREEAQRNYPMPAWMKREAVEGTINIAVVGNAGVGKSLLINKLRRVRPHAKGWAPVGVNETTREPTMYPFPGEKRVRLWDLPGSGTEAVPSETYVQDMGLRYFDKVLIATAHRFTSTEVTLREELERHGVPYFMVRTKVDIDVYNNAQDNNMNEGATVKVIQDDFKKNKVPNPYLVSSRDPEVYDFPRLLNDLFPGTGGLKHRLDPAAASFQPGAEDWNDAWAMPSAYSSVLAGLQGRWRDNFQAVYLIQGNQAHVALHDGQRAVVPLTEGPGVVWWVSRWYLNDAQVLLARRGTLTWLPVNPAEKPLVWCWSD